MTSDDERHLRETVLVNADLHNLLAVWRDRSADPLVVCTMMLVQFTSLAGHLFEDEAQYDAFLAATIKRGKHRFEQDRSNPSYIQ
jgi:hypothetical protein